MPIAIAQSDVQIQRCFVTMVELRTHLSSEVDFVERVRRQQLSGYHLVFLEDDGAVRSVAGFRFLETLSHGKFLYIDDLVTNAADRSQGYGDRLFDWLVDYAIAQGCRSLDLDSGVQRFAAHRFYLQKRMDITAHHFALNCRER